MAKRYVNECVGCPQGCIDCGRKRVVLYFCDECGEEFDPDDLYEDGNRMVCGPCILGHYDHIERD